MTNTKYSAWAKENRSFKTDLEAGKNGENTIYKYLKNLPDTKDVEDISNTPRGIEDDIDFEVMSETETYTVELKTDLKAGRTGNLPFEKYSHGNPGCLWRTKADYVIFYLPDKNQVLWIDIKAWQEYTAQKSESCMINMGEGARGFLDRISTLKSKGIILFEDKAA